MKIWMVVNTSPIQIWMYKNKIWMERRMDQDIIFSVSRSLSLE